MHVNGDDPVDVPAYIDANVSTKMTKLIQSYVGDCKSDGLEEESCIMRQKFISTPKLRKLL